VDRVDRVAAVVRVADLVQQEVPEVLVLVLVLVAQVVLVVVAVPEVVVPLVVVQQQVEPVMAAAAILELQIFGYLIWCLKVQL